MGDCTRTDSRVQTSLKGRGSSLSGRVYVGVCTRKYCRQAIPQGLSPSRPSNQVEMTLAEPELTEDERTTLRDSGSLNDIHGVSTDSDAALFEVTGGFYKALTHDRLNLAARVGDYNAEWLGKTEAEKWAVEGFCWKTDHDPEDVKAVVEQIRNGPADPDNVYYRVALVTPEV